MPIRKETATTPEKLNFKAIWWVNISSVLLHFKLYPAFKTLIPGTATKHINVLGGFLFHMHTLKRRLNYKSYFSIICILHKKIDSSKELRNSLLKSELCERKCRRWKSCLEYIPNYRYMSCPTLQTLKGMTLAGLQQENFLCSQGTLITTRVCTARL